MYVTYTHAYIQVSAVSSGQKIKKLAADTVALSWALAMLHSKVLTEKEWKLRMEGIATIEDGLKDKKVDVPLDFAEKLTLCKDKAFQVFCMYVGNVCTLDVLNTKYFWFRCTIAAMESDFRCTYTCQKTEAAPRPNNT